MHSRLLQWQEIKEQVQSPWNKFQLFKPMHLPQPSMKMCSQTKPSRSNPSMTCNQKNSNISKEQQLMRSHTSLVKRRFLATRDGRSELMTMLEGVSSTKASILYITTPMTTRQPRRHMIRNGIARERSWARKTWEKKWRIDHRFLMGELEFHSVLNLRLFPTINLPLCKWNEGKRYQTFENLSKKHSQREGQIKLFWKYLNPIEL